MLLINNLGPTLKLLLTRLSICFALVICLLLYGRTHFYRDPGSVFFDPGRALEQKYSLHRQAEIQSFVTGGGGSGKGYGKAGANASVCLGISSVRRPEVQYLETAIASILHGLDEREREDLFLSVVIAQTVPYEHPSWDSKWLKEAVDEMGGYVVSQSALEEIGKMEKAGDYKRKGVRDYMNVLQHCYDTEKPYIAILEDDVLMADGWLVRTLLGLKEIPKTIDGKPNDWLFTRLFSQDRSIGWSSQEIGGNNEAYIATGVAVAVLAIGTLFRLAWAPSRRFLDWTTLLVVALVLNPALVILFFQSGKVSVLPRAAGVFNQPFGCCSQSLVFPREIIPTVLEYLQERKSGQVDLMLNQLSRDRGFARYALYPVQAQHLGISSARKTTKEDAQEIWSVGFEDLDSKWLKREHERMVAEYYAPII